VLTWSQRYRLRAAVSRRLWPIPSVFAVFAVGLAQLVAWLDRTYTPASPPVTFDSDSTLSTLAAIASGMLVFIGFVFSVVTFAIQYEASTYTPRLLRTIANSTAMRLTLGVFIATFVYALLLLAQTEPDREYRYSVIVAVILVGVSLLFFLALMTEVADRARSGRTVGDVGRAGRRTIERTCGAATDSSPVMRDELRLPDTGRVVHQPDATGGVIQAIDVDGIVNLAAHHDVIVELVSDVGSFVESGVPLFRVHGGTAAFPDEELLASIATGEERTSDQDPRLSIRILVDIAIRALSPAINDPTTAVEALERIGDLLLLLSTRELPDGIHRDGSGMPRLVEPTTTWDDYLTLALTEIRIYGVGSPFVVSALRRILDLLLLRAPAPRRPAIDRQARLLDRAEQRAEPGTATSIDPASTSNTTSRQAGPGAKQQARPPERWLFRHMDGPGG
jgi:uncharacterized membrane protein